VRCTVHLAYPRRGESKGLRRNRVQSDSGAEWFGNTGRFFCILLPIILTQCACLAQSQPRLASLVPTPLPVNSSAVFDDFMGPAGSRPNDHIWGYDIDPPGRYNDELQAYTTSSENVRLDGQGHLVIEARKESDGYTSGRLNTRGKLNMLYGTITARIKFPIGEGLWPAFWMLGSNMDAVGWPDCGEIDIMELTNTGSKYIVTLLGPGYTGDHRVRSKGPISDLTRDFHNYWVNWRQDSITIGIDGTTLGAFDPSSLPPGAKWVFDHPMYALLNVAVGGYGPGHPPDASTTFPATMLVDWFRYTPDWNQS
jgi:beta-glucanase (GH16 family)